MQDATRDGEYWKAAIAARYPLVQHVFEWASSEGISLYLVGGTVRDLLMHVDTHDLDFAVDGDGLEIARRLADRLHGAYVPLDKERRTGRIILPRWSGARSTGLPGHFRLDVASMRGPDLVSDLRDRDFTINAIAIGQSEGGWHLYDPLDGLSDIRNRVLRMASTSSFADDPVRTMRAVRMHIQFQCSLDPETRLRLLSAAPLLATVSAERVRDEWFNILMRPAAAVAIAELAQLGLLRIVAPPMEGLRGAVCSSAQADAFAHALAVVAALEQWWTALHAQPSGFPLSTPDAFAEILPDLLQRYDARVCDERTRLGLLKCAGLLHNIARSQATASTIGLQRCDAGDERESAEIAVQLARAWRLSNAESLLLRIAVGSHHLATQLAQEPAFDRRTVYRYFRQTGEHGVDAALVSLAHYVASWQPLPSDPRWRRQAKVVIELLTAFFRKYATVIAPRPLLSGTDMLALFGVSPGPLVGQLLDRLQEAQAAGDVCAREEAEAAVAAWLIDTTPTPQRAADGHQVPPGSL